MGGIRSVLRCPYVKGGKIWHQESRFVLIRCNLGTWSSLPFEGMLHYATLPSKFRTSPSCVRWSNVSQSHRKTRGKAGAAATLLLKDMVLRRWYRNWAPWKNIWRRCISFEESKVLSKFKHTLDHAEILPFSLLNKEITFSLAFTSPFAFGFT